MYSKIIVVVFSVFVSNVLAADYCFSEIVGACSPVGGGVENCNAKYGAVNDVLREIQNFANLQISRNWQFLLMSTHFANYETERPGLTSLYKGYADKLWNDAIDEVKYLTKRGGKMDFFFKKKNPSQSEIENYDFTEIGSLAKSLDLWKSVAEETHYIHGEVTRRREASHDPEVASHYENKYVHEHADIIRDLAGNINNLKQLLESSAESNVSLFLFDNYIKNSQ